MGGTCSSVAPLSPTVLAAAYDEERNGLSWGEDSDVDDPSMPQRLTTEDYSTISEGSDVSSPQSISRVKCAMDGHSDRASPSKFLNVSSSDKPALRRSSILKFKLRSQATCYAVPSRSPGVAPRHPNKARRVF
eukprot:EG_transcript_8338